MGTYSTEEWRELFGGDPEPGEAYLPLHAADHLRKSARENGHHCHRALNTSAGGDAVSTPSGSGSAPPAEDLDDIGCDCCGAPADEECQWWCMGEQIS